MATDLPPVCSPVLETATIKYSIKAGCRFLDPEYLSGTPNAHPGVDINDVRGGDSDKGNRVRVITDGYVEEVGSNYGTWGGIVLVYHPAYGIYTQYAHLDGITVQQGQRLRMGDILGHVGKGGWKWAHLHFEVRRFKAPAAQWPGSMFKTRAAATKFIQANYHDGAQWLSDHGAIWDYDQVMEIMAARDAKSPPLGRAAATEQRTEAPEPARRWLQVFDPATGKPIPGEYISVRQRGEDLRLFKVPAWQLREEGML